MKHQAQIILMVVTFLSGTGFGLSVNAEDSTALDVNIDGRVSFQESRAAFDITCCELDAVDVSEAVTVAIAEQHAARVDFLTRIRTGQMDVDADGDISFRESQLVFQEPCCNVDIAVFDEATRDMIVQRHIIRVDRWSEFRGSRPLQNGEI